MPLEGSTWIRVLGFDALACDDAYVYLISVCGLWHPTWSLYHRLPTTREPSLESPMVTEIGAEDPCRIRCITKVADFTAVSSDQPPLWSRPDIQKIAIVMEIWIYPCPTVDDCYCRWNLQPKIQQLQSFSRFSSDTTSSRCHLRSLECQSSILLSVPYQSWCPPESAAVLVVIAGVHTIAGCTTVHVDPSSLFRPDKVHLADRVHVAPDLTSSGTCLWA